MRVHVVMNEGEMVYASENEDEAEAYAFNRNVNGIAGEIDSDDPTYEDIAEAAFMNGFNGGHHEVLTVDTEDANDEEEITMYNGDTVTLSDIRNYVDVEDNDYNNMEDEWNSEDDEY